MTPVQNDSRTQSSNSIKSSEDFEDNQSELFRLFFKEYAITAE